MRSVEDEVSLCLRDFTRLCVAEALSEHETLKHAANSVAQRLNEHFPPGITPELRSHFEATLWRLTDLVSALGVRLTPQTLKSYCEQSSQSQVAATLARSLDLALKRGQSGAPSSTQMRA